MIILDTNVLSELMRPEPSAAVVGWMGAQPLAALHVTTLSYAEILLGVDLLPEGRRRRQLAEQADGLFAEDFAGRVLPFDLAAAPAYAAIAGRRQRAGQPLGAVDGMIAAIARAYGASALSTWQPARHASPHRSAAQSFTPPCGRKSPAATPGRPRRGRAGTERPSSDAGADGSGRRSWRAPTGSAAPAPVT